MTARLLLVEDSDDLRHLFARVLRGHGFEVVEASDGYEALDRLAEFVPEVVVTDVMMPGMDGVELIRRIRAMPATAEVPVVAMSAAPTPEAEREALRAGAEDLLPKPLDSQTLLERLAGLCRLHPTRPRRLSTSFPVMRPPPGGI